MALALADLALLAFGLALAVLVVLCLALLVVDLGDLVAGFFPAVAGLVAMALVLLCLGVDPALARNPLALVGVVAELAVAGVFESEPACPPAVKKAGLE